MEFLENALVVVSDFADPHKRIFIGYLLLSVVMAVAWLMYRNRLGIRAALRKIFDRRVFFSDSAIADYKIFVINKIVMLLLSPVLVTQLAIAAAFYYWLQWTGLFTEGALVGTDPVVVITLYTITLFLVDDFSRFIVHRWMHKWPLLWAIHKTHHSATTMTPLTLYRIHPLEGILYGLRGTMAQGSTLPVFAYFFGGSTVDIYTVLGVNATVFFVHVTGSNLRHSHISIHFWPWLERFLMSPAQHQLHHSVAHEHHDKNFGATLAIWDYMLGSLHLSVKDTELKFGLEDSEQSPHADLRGIYVQPVREVGSILKDSVMTVVRPARDKPGSVSPSKTPESLKPGQ